MDLQQLDGNILTTITFRLMDIQVYKKHTGCYYYKTLFIFYRTGHIPFLIKIFINTYCATFHINLSYIRQQEDSTKDDATSGLTGRKFRRPHAHFQRTNHWGLTHVG